MGIGPWQIILILVIVLIIFGAGKLPRVAGDIAKGVKNFKKGLAEDGDGASTEEYESFAEFLEDDEGSDEAEPDAAADSTGGAEEAPVYETFDDVVAEFEGADNADSSSASEADDPESAGAEENKDSTPKRRKKKISFV